MSEFSNIPPEVTELFTEKARLEQQINSIVREFESRYNHKILVDCINIQRMRAIGPVEFVSQIELKVR